ncbi:hypothetical protein HF086_003034 [Spodoptera exigua]|uniref:Uncharacterized protein n=1 Tax=Spodoptera exigua TaxID=7107 RepID=A0A922MR00_SPOEX|nr:hypothetical protein HF086_003034 [Spodoptera exigua]
MADDGSATGGAEAGQAGEPEPATARPLHPRSFKLRFASQREQGRSYVSLVRPLGLPATVTGKFYVSEQANSVDEEATRRALQRIQRMFGHGPTDKYDAPVTSSHVCFLIYVQVVVVVFDSTCSEPCGVCGRVGWYATETGAEAGAGARADRRLQHHIRDSAWLKARLCVLAADDKLKQRY